MLLHAVLRGDEAGDAGFAGLTAGDWDELLRLASAGGLVPLLYRRLNRRAADAVVPAEVGQRLRNEYVRTAARNALLYRRVAEVFDALHGENIPVIVLKGLHLAELVYGNIGLRPMGDADVLVRRGDLGRAVEVMRALGFQPARDLEPEAVCAVSQHLPPFTRADAPAVEIHWHICRPDSPFTISIDDLWRRAEPATVGGARVLVLAPADLLLHLCLHAAFQHRFDVGPRVLYDIAATVEHRPAGLDWERVIAGAVAWGATKPAYLMLRLARDVAGARVPAAVLDALDPGDAGAEHLPFARARLLGLMERAMPLSQNLTRVWTAAGLRRKLVALLEYALPPREVLAGRYPVPADSWRVYLYYPVRIKDLIVRHGWSAWELLRREGAAVAAADHEQRVNAMIDWLGTPPQRTPARGDGALGRREVA